MNTEHTARFDSILGDTLRKHWRVSLDLSSSVFATSGSPASQLRTGKAAVSLASMSHLQRPV